MSTVIKTEQMTPLEALRDRELLAAEFESLCHDFINSTPENIAEIATATMTDGGLARALIVNPSFLRTCIAQTLARVIERMDA